MVVNRRILKILAALVWLVGGVVLALKGVRLIHLAVKLQPHSIWPKLAIGLGVLAGIIKAWLVFSAFCRENLKRIDGIQSPRLWQFFRPGFFLFLGLMVATGALLYRLALGSFALMIAVGLLDIALATALLGSSLMFRFR
jgi:hypothetical protein